MPPATLKNLKKFTSGFHHGLLMASLLFALPVYAQSPETNAAIYIEAQGSVPGLNQNDLDKLLADSMQKVKGIPWRFAVKASGSSSPNRVVWKFMTLRKVWKGGTHNGFPSMPHSVFYLSAEAKLYLNNDYQITVNAHPSVLDSDRDNSLADIAQQVAQEMKGELEQKKM